CRSLATRPASGPRSPRGKPPTRDEPPLRGELGAAVALTAEFHRRGGLWPRRLVDSGALLTASRLVGRRGRRARLGQRREDVGGVLLHLALARPAAQADELVGDDHIHGLAHRPERLA